MAGEDDTTPEELDDLDQDLIGDDEGDDEEIEQAESAAQNIELVILPVACTNEGKGAPLAMGVQRWWAQELASKDAKAAAPVFTAMADQDGQKVPALMVFREKWTDERALEGIARFPNAKEGLITNMAVSEDGISYDARLVKAAGESLEVLDSYEWSGKAEDLGESLFAMLTKLAKNKNVTLDHADHKEAFGTENPQALTSFLVGLGNLSALQGRCVPTTPDQLLSPLMDALGRDAEMDPAAQALHLMVDILVNNPIDQSAIPLSLQALNIAAQRRKTDQSMYHHLASLFRRLGDMGSAVQAFNQAFNLDPTNAQVTNQFVATLRGAGDKANAMKVAEFAAEKGNEDPALFGHIGALMIEDDKFDEAEPFLRRAIDEGQVASAYGDLANVLWDRGDDEGENEDREEALQLLSTAVESGKIAKSSLDILLDLHEEEKNEKATLLLLKAAEKFPKSATVLRYVATMYLDGDDPPKAGDYLDKILALPRRSLDDDAFARRGKLTLTIEDFEDKYDEALEGVRSSDAAKQTAAAQFLRQVIATDERFWQPHMMLALAVRESEGDTAALGHLTTAVKLRPNDPEIGTFIGGLGLFLLAVSMISDGLKLAAGDALKDILGQYTRTRLRGVAAGMLVTATVQSSSAVTVATIGFVNAGLLTLNQSLGVVYGANIGTTMTGWIVAIVGFNFKIEALALPLIGLGMLSRMLRPNTRLAHFGEALAGFGLFFIGVDFLRDAFEGFADDVDIAAFAPQGGLGIALYFVLGFFMTLVTQSSSAAIAITLTAATGGVLGIDAAAAMVIGSNVGTTSTAALAVIGATANARRVAAAHVIFNLLTGVVALILLAPMLWLVRTTGSALGLEDIPAVTLALFHTVFNFLGVVLMWPLTSRLATFLSHQFTTQADRLAEPQFLDRNVMATPSLAIEALYRELVRAAGQTGEAVTAAINLEGNPTQSVREQRHGVRTLLDRIETFVTEMGGTRLPEELLANLPVALRITGYLEEVLGLIDDLDDRRGDIAAVDRPPVSQVIAEFKAMMLEHAMKCIPSAKKARLRACRRVITGCA